MQPGEVAHGGSPPSVQCGQHQGPLWWDWTSGAARQSWEQGVPTRPAGLLQTGLSRTPNAVATRSGGEDGGGAPGDLRWGRSPASLRIPEVTPGRSSW